MPSGTRGKKGTAAAAAPALPLEGCCIAFSGTFSGRTQAALLAYATRLGAQSAKSITKDITHLITTDADYAKPSTKVQQARERGAHIVDLDWMLQSESTDTKQPESKFLLKVGSFTPPLGTPPPSDALKKRQAPGSPAPDPKKMKVDASDKSNVPNLGKGQIAKDWAVKVPVDEGCSLSGYGVHVDEDRIIWDATLNQTNAGNNNNKFYRLQLLVGPNNHCQTWTRWGRVGDYGQIKILGDGSLADAKLNFEKKFKDKSGLAWENRVDNPKPKKYVFLERNYDSDSDDEGEEDHDGQNENAKSERKPPPCTLEPPVKELMELIFNQQYFAAAMANMNYDDKKMPLGKLSKATIMRGFQTLKDLSTFIENPASVRDGDPVQDLSNLFYSLIPHDFGRERPPIINNLVMVKKEIELLETLTDLKDATDVMKTKVDELVRMHPLDRQYHGLGMQEMTPLDPATEEFGVLESYLMTTRGYTHNSQYSVENIFRIERQGEKDRFHNSPFSGPIRDRRLLWHGSRATNFGGILSQGLRIAPPEAPANGYMFDKGVYLADMSSKSANYCAPGISGGTALLLLCEAELGNPMQKLTHSNSQAAQHAKNMGAWSTLGQGATGPSVWKDASCVHPLLKGVMMPSTTTVPPGQTGISSSLLYNEYICYDVAQIRLRYLFRVKVS